MASEIWAFLIVGGVATIAIVAIGNHLIEQTRLRRLRVLAATNLFMQECWNTLASVPLPFLPRPLRVTVAKVLRARLRRAMRYHPDNDRLQDHARRIEELELEADAKVEAEVFEPARRREIRRDLMDVKRMCAQAAINGHISEDERSVSGAIVDALCLRLLIDHLIDAASAAEGVGSFDEARTLFVRAMEELTKVDGHNAVVERTQLEHRLQEVDIKLAAKQTELAKEFDEAMKRDGGAPPSTRQARYE